MPISANAMTTPPRCCRLPPTFDAASLLTEAATLPVEAWAAHFNAGYHNGGWTGIA